MIDINAYTSILRRIAAEYAYIRYTVTSCQEIICELYDTCNFRFFEEYPDMQECILQLSEDINGLLEEQNPFRLYSRLRFISQEFFEVYDFLSEIYEEILCSEEEEDAERLRCIAYPSNGRQGAST